MLKRNILFLLLAFFTALFSFSSCKKSKSDIGAVLFKESRNKVFKKIDSAKYYQVFRQMLADSASNFRSPEVMKSFYKARDYEPYFIVNFFPDEKLEELLTYYQKAPEHGLSPDLFDYSELKLLLDKLYDKKGIKTPEEAYPIIAYAELLSANSLIKYTNAMKFGTVDPRRIFARYYMKTARPDSASMTKTLEVTDLKAHLDSIQPKNPNYKNLQQALKQGIEYLGLSKEETARVIKLNLERMRWQNKKDDKRYVWVNIPDYSLTYFENGKPALRMKVIVGEAKEPRYYEKLREYNVTGDIDDRPFNHETPILRSEINTIVVNPIWNIPKSIAQSEIAVKAAEDPYFLSNNNIMVYYNGEEVDPYMIDWNQVSRENIKFDFKQAPGRQNALGKMKFLFPNSSSVYLHDTPAKQAFDLEKRALSHGCVRVEKPLELARAIAGSGKQYDRIAAEFNGEVKQPDSFSIKDEVPVYLDYQTCWVDENGNIQIRPDVYFLDRILYRKMADFLSK